MGKVVTLKKQKKSEKKLLKEHIPFKSIELSDPKLVSETLLECIKENDLESFREVLAAFFLTVNKVDFAKKLGIGRRTLYDLIDSKKDFNPELSTVSTIISKLAA